MGQRQPRIQAVVGLKAEERRQRAGGLDVAPVSHDDAFRVACGAGGVDQLQRAVRAGTGQQLGLRRTSRQLGIGDGIDSAQLLGSGLALVGGQADEPLQAGDLRAHGADFGQRVVPGHHRLAADRGEHVVQFVALGTRIDRYQRQIQQRAGDHQVDELGMVGQQRAELVARAQAKPVQAAGQTLALLPQLGKAARFVGAHTGTLDRQHGKVRAGLGLVLDHSSQSQRVVPAHLSFPGSAS